MTPFPQFYNQSLRKYITVFGNMFNGMVVQRLGADGATVQTIGVPITYAPKEKWLARMTLDPNLTRPIAVQLPNMAFEITSMSYDGSRKLASTTKIVANNTKSMYVGAPWNINFALYCFVRNADDAAQLLEQILPFFSPEWTNSVRLIPEMGESGIYDVPTTLNDVNMEDVYEGDFITRRALVYTLNFTMMALFFGPVRTSGSRSKVIKRVQLDFHVPRANTSTSNTAITDYEVATAARSSRVVITPGLLANGSPTTNSAASINYQLISSNSNYGIASNTFFFLDGRKYNPATGNDE